MAAIWILRKEVTKWFWKQQIFELQRLLPDMENTYIYGNVTRQWPIKERVSLYGIVTWQWPKKMSI